MKPEKYINRYTILGAIAAFIFNFFFLELFIIPDICYYHSHETNFIFDIFYSLPGWNGFHPVPTKYNFIITILIGGYIGYRVKERK